MITPEDRFDYSGSGNDSDNHLIVTTDNEFTTIHLGNNALFLEKKIPVDAAKNMVRFLREQWRSYGRGDI